MQTVKPRATPKRHGDRIMWRVTFPDSPTGYVGSTIDKAVGVAYRCRLARMLSSGRAHIESMLAVLP